jgi:hypothetical protein
MRARAAYISSLGTGGILVASALLMLAMVSALVAFHAWPAGHTAGGSVSAVPLTPSAATPAVHEAAPVTRARPAVAHRTRAHLHRAAAVSTAGLTKVPAGAHQIVSRRATGVFKLPSTTGPATPPVPYPPPSTGSQHHRSPPNHTCGCAPPPKPPLHIPEVPLPGDVNGTTTGVVGSIPPPPDDQNTSSPVPLPLDTVTATVIDLTR